MSWTLVGQIAILAVVAWIPLDSLASKFIKHDTTMRNRGVKK